MIKTEVTRGRPIQAGGVRLVPIVRRTSGVWRRATIGRGVGARGGGFVHLYPIGVVVQEGESERFIAIPDETRWTLRRFLAVGVAVMLLSLWIGWMAGALSREEEQDGG
ncbi:MAG TPA: hypothetical protein ENK08_07740 [Chloroflexi bacterium]|nr:hypothetical protein [Chloroflexota bacterium]